MLPFPSALLCSSAAGGASSSFSGALAYKTADIQTAFGVPGITLTWDSEAYDSASWHDTSSSTSRLTAPSGVALVEISTNVKGGKDVILQHTKGGATFVGMGKADCNGGGTDYCNITSALIAVAAGDYFESVMGKELTGTAGGSANEQTWFSIAALDSSTRYALVKNSASISLSAGVTTTLGFNTETVDTGGWHDTVTNNSRLTVISGATLVRVRGNVAQGNVTGRLFAEFLKNGSTARGLPARDTDTTGDDNVNLISAPLEVVAGDYFEMTAFATAATAAPTADYVWASIEEVVMPATYQRALVYKSGSQTIAANTFAVTLTWDQEVYDTASIHNNATNNSRLTVPAGCTKARVIANVRTSSAGSEMSLLARKNGADFYGMPRYNCDTGGTDNLNVASAWVDVTAGDYFEALFYSFSGCTIGSDNETWFCLECQ